MDAYVVALDIGGSKAHLVVETLDRMRVVDERIPSFDWTRSRPTKARHRSTENFAGMFRAAA